MSDICIIGAGSSGVTVAKSLAERGLTIDIYEKGRQIGGMWRYENDNGQSSCYASRHIDTSRENLGYSDFPIDRWGGFLTRKLRLPAPWARRVMARLIRLGVGDERRFGLPRPAHPMWREHATLSQDLLPNIGHGYISVKPNVADVDVIIYATGYTGYNVCFPMLPENAGQQAEVEAHRR